MNTNTNNVVATTKDTTTLINAIALTPVETAIINSLPDSLKAKTETAMKAVSFSSGVSLKVCEILFNIREDKAALKQYGKPFGDYTKDVLRIDGAQASRYATMFERLFYDVDEPFKKLETTRFNVSQLVAISQLKDRTIRKMFINFDGLTEKISAANITKAVKYLTSFDRNTVLAIKWAEVKEILETGTTAVLESEKEAKAKAKETTVETAETTAETAETDTITDGIKTHKFNSFKELEKWLKENTNIRIDNITINYVTDNTK